MQRNVTPSSVWHRRTNRLIATAIIVIGFTMMISNITQCIYIGMLFIIIALVWLAWLSIKERKLEPPRPEDQPSPVLFLVTSHMLPRNVGPTAANPIDKPPSYDQILSLDGLPPDYSSVIPEKPPRYEDLTSQPGPSSITYSNEKEVNSKSRKESTLHHTRSNSVPGSHGNETVVSGAEAGQKNLQSANSSSLKRPKPPATPDPRSRKRHSSSGGSTSGRRASVFSRRENNAADVHRSSSTNAVASSSHISKQQPQSPLLLHVSNLQLDVATEGSSSYINRGGSSESTNDRITDSTSSTENSEIDTYRNIQNVDNELLKEPSPSKVTSV